MTRTFLRFFFPYQPLCFPVVVLSPCPNYLYCIPCQSSSYRTGSQVNIRSVFFPSNFLALKHSSLDPISTIHTQLFLFSSKQLVKLLSIFYHFPPPHLVTTHSISYPFILTKNLIHFVRLRERKKKTLSQEGNFLVFPNCPVLCFHTLAI